MPELWGNKMRIANSVSLLMNFKVHLFFSPFSFNKLSYIFMNLCI